MATHNNYIDLISQTGVVGSAFYLAIFGVLLWRGWVVYNRVKGRRDFSEALAVAALGGTCGCIVIMAFGDWLLPFAYTQTIAGFSYSVYNWLFMGTIVSLDFITGSQARLPVKLHA
jgi:O-antigen ligase